MEGRSPFRTAAMVGAAWGSLGGGGGWPIKKERVALSLSSPLRPAIAFLASKLIKFLLFSPAAAAVETNVNIIIRTIYSPGRPSATHRPREREQKGCNFPVFYRFKVVVSVPLMNPSVWVGGGDGDTEITSDETSAIRCWKLIVCRVCLSSRGSTHSSGWEIQWTGDSLSQDVRGIRFRSSRVGEDGCIGGGGVQM